MTYDIQGRRLYLNKTQGDIAEEVGVTKATVSKWEQGDIANMRRDKILSLSEALNISPLLLIGATPIPSEGMIQIPILGTIACGSPILAEENIEDYKERPAEGLPSGDLFYLQAQGDSMAPSITDGSYVLIKQQEDVENGEIAAVLVNGDEEATLKRVHKAEGYIILESINEDYENYLVDRHNPAKIIGKAVEVVNKL